MKKIIFGSFLILSGVILYGIGVFNYVYINDLEISVNKYIGIFFIMVGLVLNIIELKNKD